MTPKVSVIIPVFNVEEYLEQCLDSVLNQTLREVEIICINDGSTDSSLEILKKFALKDSRIKIIDKKNEGPSAARNEGIKTAAAPYISFLDADDYLEHNALEETFKCAENSDVALVCFGTNIVGEVSPKQKASDERYYAVDTTGVVELTDELRLNMNAAPWNKLFKISVIKENNVEFPFGLFYEDYEFCKKYSFCIKKAYYLNKKLYNYRRRPGSTMAQTFSRTFNREFDSLFVAQNIYNFLVEKDLYKDHIVTFNKIFEYCFRFSLKASPYGNRKKIIDKACELAVKMNLPDDEEIFRDLKNKNYSKLLLPKYSFLEQIFSLKNFYGYKFVCILGIKMKIKNQ